MPDVAGAAFRAGCRWISLREKDMAAGEHTALLRRLQAIGRTFGATVGVHGCDLIEESGDLEALHLPAAGSLSAARGRFGGGILLGISAHSIEEARRAEEEGADYVTYSPVFESLSKPGYGKGGNVEALAAVARRVSLPVIALGGIEASKIADCMKAGAAGVAVMGAVMAAGNPKETASALVEALRGSGS